MGGRFSTCAAFDGFASKAGTCAAGDVCWIQGGGTWVGASCRAAPETPGLVAQVGVGLLCGGSKSGQLLGSGIELSCHCYSEAPAGCSPELAKARDSGQGPAGERPDWSGRGAKGVAAGLGADGRAPPWPKFGHSWAIWIA
jgi:hypothetical protein